MNKMKMFSIILLIGSIWGILEATLGYALQFLPPLVSGSIMFPIGALLLLFTYKHTGSKTSMIYVAFIAATIKSINFFMPGLMPIKTYNPMIAIMLQSLVMVVIIPMTEKKSLLTNIVGLSLASITWRLLFLFNIMINNSLTGFQFQQLQNVSAMIQFVLILGLMGALFLSILYIFFMKVVKSITYEVRPSLGLSFSMVILAMVLTFYMQFIS